jgi:hypothetical protein
MYSQSFTKINPADDLRKTKIWQRLNKLNPEKAENISNFVGYTVPYLSKISEYFPDYKRHNYRHSYRVLDRISDIILPELLEDDDEGLREDELLCLIVSVYVCGIGLAVFEKDNRELYENLKLPINIEHSNTVLQEKLKENHADRRMIFLRSHEVSQFVPVYYVIELLMKGRDLPSSELKTDLSDEIPLGNTPTDLRSLVIILSCADMLEFSDTKILDAVHDEAKRRGDKAAEEGIKEIRSIHTLSSMSVNKAGVILVAGSFEKSENLHALHRALNLIEEYLEKYIELDLYFRTRFQNGVLKIKDHSIDRQNLISSGFEYIPLEIKIDEYGIKNLFADQNLWGKEPWQPLKELIQNAIDACRYREFIASRYENCNSQIEIMINSELRELTVIDNGIGMNKYDITDFFLQIGNSKTNSQEFLSNSINKKFHPIARFGVGFWSVFTIASKASVKTRYKNNEEGYIFEVTLEPVMTYLELRKEDNLPVGTTIKLKIKDGIDISRITGQINNCMISSPVPIFIKNENGNLLHHISKELPEITMENFFTYRLQEAVEAGLEVFQFSYDTENIEIGVGILYSRINGRVHCLIRQDAPILFFKPVSVYFTTSVCGLVTKIDLNQFPFAFNRVGIALINIKSPEGLDFTFHRNKIEENERLLEIKDDINICIAKALRQFYDKAGATGDPKKIGLLIAETRTNGGEAGDERYPDLYNIYRTYYEGIVAFYVWKWEKFKGNVKYKKQWMFVEDFWKLDKPVVYIVLWPSLYLLPKEKENKVNNWASNEYESGYLLLASHEASAIVDVANRAKVKYAKYPYIAWNNRPTKQYIEINPAYGYSEYNKSFLFELKSYSNWHVFEVEFEQSSTNLPWLTVGRYKMFLDMNHRLTEEIKRLYKTGNIWKVSKILSLMASSNAISHKEIETLTGIKLFKTETDCNDLSQEKSVTPHLEETIKHITSEVPIPNYETNIQNLSEDSNLIGNNSNTIQEKKEM